MRFPFLSRRTDGYWGAAPLFAARRGLRSGSIGAVDALVGHSYCPRASARDLTSRRVAILAPGGASARWQTVDDALPPEMRGASFAEGGVDRIAEERRVAWATVHVRRSVPWCVAAFGPALTTVRSSDGHVGRVWGQAWPKAGAMAVDTTLGGRAFRQTLHHELWHAAERALSPEAIDIVTAAVVDGPSLEECRYEESPDERRADAYEAWATLVDRVPERPAPPPGLTIEAVFHAVYTGAVVAAMRERGDLD